MAAKAKETPVERPPLPPGDDGEAPKRRGPKLKTLQDARAQFADLYRKTKLGLLAPKVANSCAFILSSWVDTTVIVDAEGRMAAIETAIAKAREAAGRAA